VYSDSPCIRSDYGVENDKDVCPNYENVFDAYTQLKDENAELKEKLEIEQNARGDWFGKAVTKDRRLTEAKELLTRFVMASVYFNGKEVDLVEQAEQFLRECK
jgi:hypothetical protein